MRMPLGGKWVGEGGWHPGGEERTGMEDTAAGANGTLVHRTHVSRVVEQGIARLSAALVESHCPYAACPWERWRGVAVVANGACGQWQMRLAATVCGRA
jgi:hypothetical protein